MAVTSPSTKPVRVKHAAADSTAAAAAGATPAAAAGVAVTAADVKAAVTNHLQAPVRGSEETIFFQPGSGRFRPGPFFIRSGCTESLRDVRNPFGMCLVLGAWCLGL